MARRDYTNQFGYFCPTENSAIYYADKANEPKTKRTDQKKRSGVLREEDIKRMDAKHDAKSMAAYFDSLPHAAEPKAIGEDPNDKVFRQIVAVINQILSLSRFKMVGLKIKHKDTGKEYEA